MNEDTGPPTTRLKVGTTTGAKTQMDEAIRDAIKVIVEKIKEGIPHHEALHYSQAALNLAHTAQVAKQVEKQ